MANAYARHIKMKCPQCHKEIDRVTVVSRCWQYANVDKDGNLFDYGSVEEILNTLKIEHECGANITKRVNQ
jgi:hypothetical protein